MGGANKSIVTGKAHRPAKLDCFSGLGSQHGSFMPVITDPLKDIGPTGITLTISTNEHLFTRDGYRAAKPVIGSTIVRHYPGHFMPGTILSQVNIC